jgi:hypothetical protein
MDPSTPSSTSSSSSSPLRSKRRRSNPATPLQDVILSHNLPLPSDSLDPFEFEGIDSDGDSTTDDDISSSIDSTSEEEEEKNKKTKVAWKKEGKEFEIPSFDMIPKLSPEAKRCVSPLDFFLLYLHSDLMNDILKATNKYGTGKFGEKWVPTDGKEMLASICLCDHFYGYLSSSNSPILLGA